MKFLLRMNTCQMSSPFHTFFFCFIEVHPMNRSMRWSDNIAILMTIMVYSFFICDNDTWHYRNYRILKDHPKFYKVNFLIVNKL